jgi:SpoVK/Ycf46/Vps4 family AAA+-type ATPase
MIKPINMRISGIPTNVDQSTAAIFRSRIIRAVEDLTKDLDVGVSDVLLSTKGAPGDGIRSADSNDHSSLVERSQQYKSVEPSWKLQHLIVSPEVEEELFTAIESIQLESLVFDAWGLRAIEPFPRSALNFHGSPGTGKTLAAHGVASELGKNIIVASYAQIESKYHGDGPKNVEAIFHAAERDNAVLFIDEADSLLSKRLTNVQQGSEQAINSMRSQLLICLEKYKGIVIFATNLVENYDTAFETRVRHVHFPKPDYLARREIWRKHLLPTLPLSDDVSIDLLAQAENDFCGREIKNSVIDAALQVARNRRNVITHQDIATAINKIVDARKALKTDTSNSSQFSPSEQDEIAIKVKSAFQNKLSND